MYEPVATFIKGQTETFLEGELLKVTQEMGLDVNREELLKALRYDRGQYEKGYADGCRDSRKQGRWETANDGTHFCSNCGCDAPYTWDDIDRNFIDSADDVPDRISDYCYKCGAKMDGGNDNG